MSNSFFTQDLQTQDTRIAQSIEDELHRQQMQIELIASENIVSRAVLEAQGSILTNKYAEGYPGHRYYGGCEYVDVAEEIAIERACQLYDCAYANVQPHSGSQANQAVFQALLKPGDKILGLSLAAGGHLTHGATPNQSGKWFQAIQYGVRPDTHLIDYNEVEQLAKEHSPKLIIAGGSAYPQIIDFVRFRDIADKYGAYLMVDMAHIAGLVAGGVHPNPLPYADVVTSTTHKTLRGPRGGLILSNNLDFEKKLNLAIFPGIQGGPLMHVIAAKAVAFGEALQDNFKVYAKQVVDNAHALAERLKKHGFDIVSNGTKTHIVLVDLRSKALTGKEAEAALERAFMTCNKNAIPFDPEKPMITSGIRLGTPAATTRGFGVEEFEEVADMINETLNSLSVNPQKVDSKLENKIRERAMSLTKRFPVY